MKFVVEMGSISTTQNEPIHYYFHSKYIFRSILNPLWTPFCSLCAKTLMFFTVFGLSRPCCAMLGPLGPLLGHPWSSLGRSWALLGRPLGQKSVKFSRFWVIRWTLEKHLLF